MLATSLSRGRRSARRAAFAAVIGLTMIVWAGAAAPPTTAAARPAPKAYVGIFNDNAVAVIDTRLNRVLTTIPIPPGPHGLAISPDGLRVYASSDGASTVSVISTVTDRVVSSIEVGRSPHGLAITPDGRLVLVAVFGTSQVAVVDTIRNQVVASIPVGNPHNLAIAPDGRTAYVAAQRPGATALAILDLTARRQVGTVPLDKTPRALSMTGDGSALYLTLAGSDAVQVLDTKRNQIVAQIPVGASPHHPLFTPNSEYGLVVAQGPGQLAVISPSNQRVIGTVTVGKFPHWIATSSDGERAYVTNEGSNSVSVVDLETRQTLATIAVGSAPRKIVVQPGPAAKAGAEPRAAVAAFIRTAALTAGPAVAADPGGIRIQNFAFGPGTVKVTPGATVVWTNADSIPHTITSKEKLWDSGPIQPGASFRVTFDKPGTYAYGCTIHPFMQATVVVGN